VPKPFGVFTSVSFQVTCDFGLSKIDLRQDSEVALGFELWQPSSGSVVIENVYKSRWPVL
jgi:hypothetical protein